MAVYSTIQGIVFPNQKVTASDHGAIFEKILSDGIIKGIDISINARNVVIGPGYLIAAGREIKNTGSITFTVPGSENHSWCRLKLRIDTTKISSLTTFDQVELIMDTASSQSGLPALITQDINGSGNIYEIALATLRMTDGVFTSIYSKIQPCAPASGIKSARVSIPVSAWSNNRADVTVEGVTLSKPDGNAVLLPIHPSNLMIIEADLKDERRLNMEE